MDAREYLEKKKIVFGITSDEELAVKIGASSSAIAKWIQRNKIPDKWEYKIGQLISTVEEPRQTYGQSNIDIPLMKLQAGAGEGIHNFLPQQTIVSLNPTLFPFASSEQATAIEIMGDSMEPVLRNGDYIIITPQEPDRITEDGVYAIRIDGMLKVKSLLFKLDGTIDIISINTRYQTENYDPNTSQIDFQILGRQRLHLSR